MLKKIRLLALAFGVSVIAAVSTAHAVPLIIDVDGATCYISGENQYAYIYTCSDGSLHYIRKNQGGGSGGGSGGDDDGCPPTAFFC